MKLSEFIDEVKQNKQIKETGGYNCIPLPFERAGSIIPGIIKGREVLISANSGIGKTMIGTFLYIFWPFLWCRYNKKSGISVRVLAYLLEETKKEFIAKAFSFFLYWEKNITIDPDDILSMKKNPLPDNILKCMYELQPLIDEFLECVIIEDNISNPTGIFKSVKEYANCNGITHMKEVLYDGIPNTVFDRYEPNNPDEYVIVYTDHISLLTPESGNTLHQTIGLFSSEYGRKHISKRYNYVNVKIQQQSAASEQQQFDNRGQSVYSKLEPSLSDLGDNKLTQRDQHLIWGLFSPHRYEIPNYLGYDMFKFKDNFRCLSVMKNRNGRSNIKIPLYFEGASCFFKELPKLSKTDLGQTFIDDIMSEEWYKNYKENKEFWFKENQTKLNL